MICLTKSKPRTTTRLLGDQRGTREAPTARRLKTTLSLKKSKPKPTTRLFGDQRG
jgi:hypothetical protein